MMLGSRRMYDLIAERENDPRLAGCRKPPKNPLITPDVMREMIKAGGTSKIKMANPTFDGEVKSCLGQLMTTCTHEEYRDYCINVMKQSFQHLDEKQQDRLLNVVNYFEDGLRTWDLRYLS